MAACAVVAFAALVAAQWSPRTGLTALLRFGDSFAAGRIPAVAALPIAEFPGSGYDGQFYAQIAVAGNPAEPALAAALDNPRYRIRRILLPALAHVLGGGRPWTVLQVYALLNVAAWGALAWLLWNRLASGGARGVAAWVAILFGIGALDSVRFSLTDLPAAAVVAGAVLLAERGRHAPALAAIAIAGLTRETSVLAAPGVRPGRLIERGSWARRASDFAIAAAPVAAWSAWTAAEIRSGSATGARNLDWPALSLVRHAGDCFRHIASGSMDGRYWFGLAAVVSLGWQSVFVLRRIGVESPWIRCAFPYALLYWILGEQVWHGYWAAARSLLPLTLAFNVALVRERRFLPHFLIGNVCALHGIYRFLP